jgi:copper chaperone NosL
MKPRRTVLRGILAAFAVFMLSACSSGDEQAVVAKPAPMHIEQGDECHVCGMIITRFPGPKAEAFTEKHQAVRKFCSTREMFTWMLQPENRNRHHTLYVHDMAQTDWNSPDDAALIDAREAYYVAGGDRKGAMGPTLASFATEAGAHTFMAKHGGRMLRFAEVTLDDVSAGMMEEMDHKMPQASSMQHSMH